MKTVALALAIAALGSVSVTAPTAYANGTGHRYYAPPYYGGYAPYVPQTTTFYNGFVPGFGYTTIYNGYAPYPYGRRWWRQIGPTPPAAWW
jgi:hypothetical protein